MVEGQSNDRGFVVVTGTSTGIGVATVSRLANNGFHVFAGVRREEDAEAARTVANGAVTPLMIDITDPALIGAAANTVEEAVAERGLAGLVNNAGIVKPGSLEFQPLDDFRRQLEVNLIGPLSVIQAFLPLIRPDPRAARPSRATSRLADLAHRRHAAGPEAPDDRRDHDPARRRSTGTTTSSCSARRPGG